MSASIDDASRSWWWANGSSSSSAAAAAGNRSGQVDLGRAIPLGMALGAFIALAVAGNVLVILSVACNRHLRTPTNYFIVNLALADLLLGTTVLPVSAALEILERWVLGRVLCDVWAALDVLCCTASILSLCVISIDRYIGVSHPLRYRAIVTEKRALLAALAVWALALVISIGPLLGWKQPPSPDDGVCFITEEPFYALFSSLGSFYVPLAVILAMYCRVYVVAKRTTRNLEAGVLRERMDSGEMTLRIHKGSGGHDGSHKGSGGHDGSDPGPSACKARGHQARSSLTVKLLQFSREKKAAKTLGVVVGMFTLCWLPFFLALPIGSFNANLRPPELLFKVIFWLGYFNSCLNPIIYPCYNREFKLAFIRLLRCRQQRQRPCLTSYNYRPSTLGSSGRWRQGSGEHADGSRRSPPSSASPDYLDRGGALYPWTPTPPAAVVLPAGSDGRPRGCWDAVAAKGDEAEAESTASIFAFSFGTEIDKSGVRKEPYNV
ncbi:alpha-1A adrenergic receptor-like [Stigmatopora argus]